MPRHAASPILAAAFLCTTGLASAQSSLPATSPTQTTTIAPIAAAPVETHGRHAYVSFADGLLNVQADNSSLNVILRDIARQTGMKITGGVPDQRVFGKYGPADPGIVLATLLGGTGVNVFLHEKTGDRPWELVLTPRTGGVTPPNPGATQFDDEAAAEAAPQPTQPQPPVSANSTPVPQPVTSNGTTAVPDPAAHPTSGLPTAAQPSNNVNGSPANASPTASTLPTTDSVPVDTVTTPTTAPSTAPSTTGIVDSPNPASPATVQNPSTTAPDGSTTSTSPNGVKTPDQIYQQLLQMQQQKAAGANGATPTTVTPSTQK